VTLAGNRPDFSRTFKDYDFVDPLMQTWLMNWRGAEASQYELEVGKTRLAKFLTGLDAFTPTLDFKFTLYVGSVDAFITTLPLALLALLNLSVFLTVGVVVVVVVVDGGGRAHSICSSSFSSRCSTHAAVSPTRSVCSSPRRRRC
jgi:hypothetical protein